MHLLRNKEVISYSVRVVGLACRGLGGVSPSVLCTGAGIC